MSYVLRQTVTRPNRASKEMLSFTESELREVGSEHTLDNFFTSLYLCSPFPQGKETELLNKFSATHLEIPWSIKLNIYYWSTQWLHIPVTVLDSRVANETGKVPTHKERNVLGSQARNRQTVALERGENNTIKQCMVIGVGVCSEGWLRYLGTWWMTFAFRPEYKEVSHVAIRNECPRKRKQ